MKSFITLLSSNDYYIGVITLWISWKKTNSRYDFYCLVTEDIEENIISILKETGIKIIETKNLPLPRNLIEYDQKHCLVNFTGDKIQTLQNYYNKLFIFGLNRFEKLIYLDADMILLKNIDNLFDKPHLSAVLNHQKNGRYYFNSALMVLEPSKTLFKDLIKFLSEMSAEEIYSESNEHHFCYWDQDYLNTYFKDWMKTQEHLIDLSYNVFSNSFGYYNLSKEDVCIAHMVEKKPWHYNFTEMYEFFRMNKNQYGYFMFLKYLDFYKEALEMTLKIK